MTNFSPVLISANPDNPPEIFVRRSLFESAVADLAADAGLVEAVRKKVYGP